MRSVYAGLAFAVLLAGCNANPTRDLAACKLEYYRVLPANISNPTPGFAQFLDTCMMAKGYKLDVSTARKCYSDPDESCYDAPRWYEFSN